MSSEAHFCGERGRFGLKSQHFRVHIGFSGFWRRLRCRPASSTPSDRIGSRPTGAASPPASRPRTNLRPCLPNAAAGASRRCGSPRRTATPPGSGRGPNPEEGSRRSDSGRPSPPRTSHSDRPAPRQVFSRDPVPVLTTKSPALPRSSGVTRDTLSRIVRRFPKTAESSANPRESYRIPEIFASKKSNLMTEIQ